MQLPAQKISIPEIAAAAALPKNVDLSYQLIQILENLLADGDWETSLFLRKAKERLRELLEETQDFIAQHNGKTKQIGPAKQAQLPEGTIKVYISLYQINGNNPQSWLHTIKNLTGYNITRPTYRNLQDVRDLINSKAEAHRHGYVEILLHESDLMRIEPVPVDALGHELLILKEGAIKPHNIVAFIHANQKQYKWENNELIQEK